MYSGMTRNLHCKEATTCHNNNQRCITARYGSLFEYIWKSVGHFGAFYFLASIRAQIEIVSLRYLISCTLYARKLGSDGMICMSVTYPNYSPNIMPGQWIFHDIPISSIFLLGPLSRWWNAMAASRHVRSSILQASITTTMLACVLR